jgi:sorbitol/mannitol transport system substrate-binding protein
MYRKDLFAEAGIQMPERPTWEQVASFAKQLKSGDRAGICLRGKPGWGDLFASMTTVVNTFGGQWYDTNWDAQLTSPEWKEAVSFYLNTLAESGQADPASFSFTECLDLFSTDRAAMWYDATSAAGSVESGPVKGKVGYVRAPVKETTDSGWLWSWNLGISAESDSQDAAWEFVRWATSKEYLNLVGSQLGWARTPPGTRESIYEVPEYKEAGGEFGPLTKQIMSEVNPEQPGVKPQPWIGIQYVSIPEFQDVGNQVSQEIVDAIAGRQTVDQALEAGQEIAQRAGNLQKEEG